MKVEGKKVYSAAQANVTLERKRFRNRKYSNTSFFGVVDVPVDLVSNLMMTKSNLDADSNVTQTDLEITQVYGALPI